MIFLKFLPVLLFLLLGVSCESTVEALTGQTTFSLAFTGDADVVFYSIQEIHTDKDFEKLSPEAKRVLQEYQTDELFKMPMLSSVKTSDSIVRVVDRKTRMIIKVSTVGLAGEVVLRIDQSPALVRSVKISPNSPLGYQIVRIN